ncbi:MAG TPA: VWA domain-containing protein, partial [Vicinamibacteria bacterium]
TGLESGSGVGFDIRRITDAGTRAGVVLYALDSRGLQATPPAAMASSSVRVMPSTLGAVEWMQRASEDATRNAMNALAVDTGGFLVHSNNDLRSGLRKMLQDTETYYVLAYEPTNTTHDGSFRRIEVQLPGTREIKVRTRAGYFAPDDQQAKTQLLAAELEALRSAQREAGMRTALTSLAPLTAIPVRLSADFLSGDGGNPSVVVSGHVDTKAFPFIQKDDRHVAALDAVAVIYDVNGEAVATLPERASISLTEADYQQALKAGLQFQKAATVKPGRYQVRFAVREDATGTLGSAWQWVQVPDLAPEQLNVSSLFLLKEGEAKATTETSSAAPDLRNAQALRRFRQGDNLYVQLYAYNPKRDASGATSLVAQAEILRGGVLLGSAAPEPIDPGEAQGPPAPHTTRIRLSRFDPGDYELRVTVTDRNANAFVARQVAFTVD